MDKNEHSSPSTQLKLTEQLSGDVVVIDNKAHEALQKKSCNLESILGILEQVYCRGYLLARKCDTTPQQQAFSRVNSFLAHGKAYELDYDLMEAIKVPDGSKHMPVIKRAIQNYKKRNVNEGFSSSRGGGSLPSAVGSMIGRSIRSGVRKKLAGTFIGKLTGNAGNASTGKAPVSDDDYVAAQKHQMGLKLRAKNEFSSDQAEKKKQEIATSGANRQRPTPGPHDPNAWNASLDDKQNLLKTNMAAGRADNAKRGETYAGDPETPEQTAATALRVAKIRRNQMGQN